MNDTYEAQLLVERIQDRQREIYLQNNEWKIDFWAEMDRTREERMAKELLKVQRKNGSI